MGLWLAREGVGLGPQEALNGEGSKPPPGLAVAAWRSYSVSQSSLLPKQA